MQVGARLTSTIHSAIARATPAEWVTQTASATQNPDSSRCSPISAMPSGVKENTPLMPSSILVSDSAGSSVVLRCQASAKSSSVNGSTDGIPVGSSSPVRPSAAT